MATGGDAGGRAPFGRSGAGAWLADRFREIGLIDVHTDEVGNVFGVRPGRERAALWRSARISIRCFRRPPRSTSGSRAAVCMARSSDNGAGIAAMLAVASALGKVANFARAPFCIYRQCREEGEGDLRGMRHVFASSRWRDAIAYSVIVDGAGADTVVAEALGSRRFEVIVRGPGGHSWTDFGTPNPIIALARAIEIFSRTPVPPRRKQHLTSV